MLNAILQVRGQCAILFQSDQYYMRHSTIPSAGTTILDDGAADKKANQQRNEKIIGNMAQLEVS